MRIKHCHFVPLPTADLSCPLLRQCPTGETEHVSSSCHLRLLEKKSLAVIPECDRCLGFFILLFLLFSRSNLLDLSFFDSKRCSPGTQGHNGRTWGTKQRLKHQSIFTFKWFAWELLNDFIYCHSLLRHLNLAENILWQWFLVTEPPLYNHLHRWRWI